MMYSDVFRIKCYKNIFFGRRILIKSKFENLLAMRRTSDEKGLKL